MSETASSTNANLVASGTAYLHGVALADFAVTCGNLTGVSLWAPVQDECSIGTLSNNIDQTLFLDSVYINSLEYSYTTGANATENYGAETDNKMWLLNDGRFVNFEEFILDATDISNGYVDLDLADDKDIAVLSSGLGFLRKDSNGYPAATHYDTSATTAENIKIVVGTGAAADTYVYYDMGTAHRLYFPTGAKVPVATDMIHVIYAANAYSATMNTYFTPLTAATRPESVGALRQGQVEVYIVDPDSAATDFENAWRLTGATVSADLTREPLTELGHLGPYDRPLTLPIPINITVESTAGDLENWAKFAGKITGYEADTLDSIALTDLMTKDNMILVIKVFEQTDEEAGNATGSGRKVLTGSSLVGNAYFNNGVKASYSANDREYALKTLVVKNLKITDENMTLDLGSNATQSFGFRSTNDLYAIKGDVSYANVKATIARNA